MRRLKHSPFFFLRLFDIIAAMPDAKSFFNPFCKPPFSRLSDIAGLKVTVMGLGLHGGGRMSARFFAEHGADVTVTDTKDEAALESSVRSLADLPNVRFALGGHNIEDFERADLVIKNPAVKLEGNKYLERARSIETDISVFLRFTQAKILAVTGSKGKSTAASAAHFALKSAGKKSFLGGNITVSPLAFLSETDEESIVVLELSSWQLADLRGRGLLKPACAVITSIMPDHQNWYNSMEDYVADKKLIYADMGGESVLACNFDDEWGKVFASEARAKPAWFSARPLPACAAGKLESIAWLEGGGRGLLSRDGGIETLLHEKTAVQGRHAKANLLAAGQALVALGLEPAQIAEPLSSFPGIPHRLELFLEEGGVRWFNDSAATIPEAAAQALSAFESPVVLVCGGTDKNLDFAPLADALHKAKRVILLRGSGTEKLIPLLEDNEVAFDGPFSDIGEAAAAAAKAAESGDCVIFSPGAASFELFKNEFDRGDKFKEAAMSLRSLR